MKKIIVIFLICITSILFSACNQVPEFKHVDAVISMDGSIEMSIDQKNWKQTVTSRDFNYYFSKSYPSFSFEPITSETGKPPFYRVFSDRREETSEGYLEIPIFLRSKTLDLVLWKSSTLSSLPIPWVADFDFQSAASNVSEGEETFATLANAIRVSIECDHDEDQVIVYERSKNYHYNNVLGSGGDLSGGGGGVPGYLSYHHAYNSSLLFGSENVIVANSITDVRESFNIELAKLEYNEDFYEGKIILRIWVERWDPDSYPVVYDQEFSFVFVFIGKKSD